MNIKKLVILLLLSITFNVYALDDDTRLEWEQAVKNTALAFYNKGEAIQYDNSSLTYVGKASVSRGQYFFNPESVTMQNKEYTVCSSFAYLVYYNAFSNSEGEGYKINYPLIGSNKEIKIDTRSEILTQIANPNTTYKSVNNGYTDSSVFNSDLAVFYIDEHTYYKNDGTTITNTENAPAYFIDGKYPTIGSDDNYDVNKANDLRQDLLSVIKPGDIISYYKYNEHNEGHVMVYIGDDTIVESQHSGTKGTYDFKDLIDPIEDLTTQRNETTCYKNKDGSCVRGTIKTFYLSGQSQSAFGDGTNNPKTGYRAFENTVNAIAIIRPFNEIEKNNYSISNEAKERNKYENLVVDKTSSINRFDSVNVGDNITYSIKLTNIGNTDYTDILVKDILPEGLEITNINNDNCTKDNLTINCTIDLNQDSSENIKYTVKVGKSLYNKYIETNKTTVNDIKLTNITTYVGRSIESSIKEKISDVKDEYYATTIEYINDVYKDYGITIDNFETLTKNALIINENPDPTISNKGPIIFCENQEQKDNGLCNNMGNIIQTKDRDRLTEYDLYWVNFDNKKYNSMYIYGRYGGVMTLNNAKDIKKRMRYIESPDFMIRDLLVINDNKMKQIYMYNGDSLFSYVEGHAVVTTTEEETNTLLGSLIGRDNFIILRPSLYEEEIIDEPIEKEIAEEPTNKEKYDTTENPKTGIVLGIYVILFLSLTLTGLILYSRKNIINKI